MDSDAAAIAAWNADPAHAQFTFVVPQPATFTSVQDCYDSKPEEGVVKG